jgi:hypothetical protein
MGRRPLRLLDDTPHTKSAISRIPPRTERRDRTTAVAVATGARNGTSGASGMVGNALNDGVAVIGAPGPDWQCCHGPSDRPTPRVLADLRGPCTDPGSISVPKEVCR